MSRRTELSFRPAEDALAAADAWAAERGFALARSGRRSRRYEWCGDLGPSTIVEIADLGDGRATLAAWVAMSLPARVASLFILPAEIGIESGGVRAALPRAEARADVNELLARLGQPPIA